MAALQWKEPFTYFFCQQLKTVTQTFARHGKMKQSPLEAPLFINPTSKKC